MAELSLNGGQRPTHGANDHVVKHAPIPLPPGCEVLPDGTTQIGLPGDCSVIDFNHLALIAGSVRKIAGSVIVPRGKTLDCPRLTTINGKLEVWEGATVALPALVSVGRDCRLASSPEATNLPNLEIVLGDLELNGCHRLPALWWIDDDLLINHAGKSEVLDLPAIYGIGGTICGSGVKEHDSSPALIAPNLVAVGNWFLKQPDQMKVQHWCSAKRPITIFESLYAWEDKEPIRSLAESYRASDLRQRALIEQALDDANGLSEQNVAGQALGV